MLLNMQDLIESDDIPLWRLLAIAVHAAALHTVCSLSPATERDTPSQNQPL